MRKVKLGTISDSSLGKMLDAKKNKGELQPYLANINVRWGSFDLTNLSLMRFKEQEQERYGLKYGDLIICEGGEPGRCAIWKEEIPNMKIQKALHRVRPHDNLDNRYLYYWFLLAGKKKFLNRFFTETTIKHLPGDKLKEIEIDLPDVTIQKNIADVLSSLDDKIQLNNRIVTELEAKAKTIYDYWFVQFDFPNTEGKPYRSSGGEMEWNEELKREIPKGWSVKSVIATYDVSYGFPFDSTLFVEKNEGNPIVRIRDISDCTISAYTSEDADPKYWLQSKDLLIGMDGNFHMNFWSGTSALLNQRCVRIRGNENFSALQAYFTSMPYINSREKNVSRTTVGHLSAEDIKSLFTFQADMETQRNATSIFESVLTKMCNAKEENHELTELRDWLLPMLMNGEVTVE